MHINKFLKLCFFEGEFLKLGLENNQIPIINSRPA